MRDLIKYVNECIHELTEYGIDIPDDYSYVIDKRCVKRMGQCRYSKKEIGISEFMLNENVLRDDHWLRDTIIHEMLHILAPMSGHKGKWKTLANQVNIKSGGKYNIKRCGDFDEMGIKRKPKEIKYVVECPDCGAKWTRIRKCKLVKHPEWFVCGKCKVNLRLKSCA